MLNLGTVRPGQTIYIPFSAFDGGTGASITISNFAVTDIEVYKDGSTTQRGSDNGYTLLDTDGIDFDGTTGIHGFSIDLADNTTGGYYSVGSKYWVIVGPITIDGQTVTFDAAYFTIGYPEAILNTTIATLASQTSFTLTDGPAEDDALNGMWAIIHDVASKVQFSRVLVSDYTGASKTVTLAAGAGFTAAVTDGFSLMGIDDSSGITTLLARLTSTRAGYLDNLSAGAVALQSSVDDLEGRLTAARAGYLDNLQNHVAQTGDSFAIVNHAAHGNVNLKALIDTIDTIVDAIKVITDQIGFTGANVNANVQVVAADAIDNVAIAEAALAEIADYILNRRISGGANGSRTVEEALAVLRNKTEIAGGTLTVNDIDDATPLWTATVTTTGGDPISSVDPD